MTEDIYTYSEDLKDLFLDLPPFFDSRIQRVKNTNNLGAQIKDQLFNIQTPSPIVLIGGKGSGKTTFLQYFFNVILSQKDSLTIPMIYLDFRNYTAQQIENTNAICSKILEDLLEKYPNLRLSDFNVQKQVFSEEIKRKSIGTWSLYKDLQEKLDEKIAEFIDESFKNPVFVLFKINEYLKKFQRRQFCVVFDNADQLDISIQEKVFLLSQSIKGNINCVVFVSLREGYYYQWKHKPPFDAFHSNVYHVAAPPYSLVLQKRIKYIIDNIEFDRIKVKSENKTIEFEETSLKKLFQVLHKALFEKSNSDVMKYLEQTSYPNIRKGLEQMNNFLVSGHTKIDEYITSQPYIPIWEFIKSISLNNRLYYNSLPGPIYNLFYPSEDNSDHFIKIKILKFLNDIAKARGLKDGLVSVAAVIENFQLEGYSKTVIDSELKTLFDYALIDTDELHADVSFSFNLDEVKEISISNTGIYYYNDLVFRFHYLDLTVQDTPIMDKLWFDKINNAFMKCSHLGNKDVYLRKQTVDLFLNYLSFEENRGRSQSNFNSHEKEDYFYVSEYIMERFKHDEERINKLFRHSN